MSSPPPRRRAGAGRARGGLARIAASVALTAALLVLVVPVTVAGVFRPLSPDWVLRLAPWDARAKAYAAQRLLLADPSRPPPAVTELALGAFRRDALAVNAYTALATVAALRGDEARATRLFGHSDRLTRREPETQLWLIEQNVQRDDIAGALRHYDVVLRTRPRLSDTLYPILISAASEPSIARELRRLLATEPPWSRDFLTHLAYHGEDAQVLPAVSRGLLDPADERDREILLLMLGRVAGLGRYDLGWTMYEDLAGRAKAAAALRDGDFAEAGGLPPFDWDYAAEAELAPERRPREAGGFALHLPAAGAQGRSARQLLRLPPGRYELRAQVGDVPQQQQRRPFLRIGCAPNETTLAEADFPATAPGGSAPMELRFAIAANCPNQWLSLWVRGDLEGGDSGAAPWIAALSLRRL